MLETYKTSQEALTTIEFEMHSPDKRILTFISTSKSRIRIWRLNRALDMLCCARWTSILFGLLWGCQQVYAPNPVSYIQPEVSTKQAKSVRKYFAAL